MRPLALRLFWIGCLPMAVPLHAAEPEEHVSAAQMLEKAKRDYGAGSGDAECDAASSGDAIIVCAKRKPTPRLDPVERFDPRPDMKAIALGSSPIPHLGGGVTMSICFLQKCPKELYFIDLKAIPEAPPGSDADKIAKGEMR